MSALRRDLYRKKLSNLLETADDEAFFIMVWATHAAQTGRPEEARRFLDFPEEAATSDISSKFAIHPWKCETLLNEVLVTPKLEIVPGRPNRRLNCQVFGAVAKATNTLTNLENAEDGLTLKRVSVLKELHRLSQRQFEWQRGFLSLASLYRSAFIYGGERTKAFFAQANGFSMDDFSLACFALRATFMDKPAVLRNIDVSVIGLSEETRNAVLNLITIQHSEARKRAAAIRSGRGHTSYKQSLFRDYPCVGFGAHGERALAPLPDLVTLRSTTGLFYDVINGGGEVRNEIAARFENYCSELLQQMLPTRTVRTSFKYQVKKGALVDSPDILVCDDQGTISVVFECKARRMSYVARFSEDPVAEARQAYEEMAKGVFQIWRFASHHRRGLLSGERLSTNAKGVVLTLDTWMSAASTMQKEVFDLARERADKDPDVTEADRIPVIFCPVEELEHTLNVANDTSFFQAIDAATEARFQGWALWSVHQEVAPEISMDNDYPFEHRVAEVLPWWDRFE